MLPELSSNAGNAGLTFIQFKNNIAKHYQIIGGAIIKAIQIAYNVVIGAILKKSAFR
ncbi:MAG: hypothetical protein WC203_02635 [Candidatus Bathyarchaeia archaeon]|nr:hypothetical protein [Thermoproteota archaeon]NLD65114.1 hypothetical protein [Thermoproteota archaeon]